MDGIAGVIGRIAQIESRIAGLTPPAGPTGVAAAGMSFDRVLGEVAFSQSLDLGGVQLSTMLDAGHGAGQVNDRGIPLELIGYGNGRIPAHALSQISGSQHTLWAPAARSFEALQAAASRDGITIGITDSYRTYDSQVSVAARKGLYSQGGLAAVPGTSMHGWGVAVDLRLDASAQAWMRTNAGRFGFVENVPREPWHWEYRPTR